MAMTFDATLKDLGRDCPQGVLAEFDQPPSLPVSVLNVDLSTVTKAADLVLGLGEPLEEIVHVEFQSSAAAWKHADLLAYNSLLFDHHHVPVHTILVLLRPQAEHRNLDGQVRYSPRPGRGRMLFEYEVVRLWEGPAQRLLEGDVAFGAVGRAWPLARRRYDRRGPGGRSSAARRSFGERSPARTGRKTANDGAAPCRVAR